MPGTGGRTDPYPAYTFFVEISGIVQASFSECSGLEASIEVMEYSEGGLNSYVHKLPGRVKYADLTLKHGTAGSDDLWKWFQDVTQGKIERKNVSIVLYDPAGNEVRRWSFAGAYPIRWTGPELRAAEGKVAIDTLVLVHQGAI
ncbi:MAG: phage tail protein [Chloroflexia bacterium]